jgi:myo-inositol 2-dehydrogenase/D-chiro-inositol 1-dehydrogenase
LLWKCIEEPLPVDESYRQAYARLDALGDVFYVRSNTCDLYDPSGFFIPLGFSPFLRVLNDSPGSFVRYSQKSGGIFIDCAIHDIDLARWFLRNAKAKKAYATGTNVRHPELAEFKDADNAWGFVEFEGGKSAFIYLSRTGIPHIL